jgi:hypothetical protein
MVLLTSLPKTWSATLGLKLPSYHATKSHIQINPDSGCPIGFIPLLGVSRLKEAHRPEILLPHHVDSRITTGGATEPVDPPAQLPARHLMMNIHRAKYHVELFQEQIQNIASDRDLFRFLKERFKTHRGRYLGVIPKRRVRLIHFVKVSK